MSEARRLQPSDDECASGSPEGVRYSGMRYVAVLVLAATACAAPVHHRTAPIIKPGEVTFVWFWTPCAKSIDGLTAVELVRKHFATTPTVHISTVMVADFAPMAVDSLLAARALHVDVFPDPKCASCAIFPDEYWSRMREGMARAGASASELDKVGTIPGSPSWIVIDGAGKKFTGDGMPLGMTMDELGGALSRVIDEARAGRLSKVTSPRVDWKAMGDAERNRAREVARDQLLRWNNMSSADVESMLSTLTAY